MNPEQIKLWKNQLQVTDGNINDSNDYLHYEVGILFAWLKRFIN